MIKKFTEMKGASAGADAADNVGTQQCTVDKSTNSGPTPHTKKSRSAPKGNRNSQYEMRGNAHEHIPGCHQEPDKIQRAENYRPHRAEEDVSDLVTETCARVVVVFVVFGD